LLGLLRTSGDEFHVNSAVLYEKVWSRAAPVLLAIPVVLWRLKTRRTDTLALMLAALGVVYFAGWQSQQFGLGRAISHAAIVVQLALAERIGWIEKHLRSTPRVTLAPYLLLLGLIVWFGHDLYGSEARARRKQAQDPRRYEFLREHVGEDDVVLAGLRVGWAVPAYAGKVVAAWAPVYWIDDHGRRRFKVRQFMSEGVPSAVRQATLDEYEVRFVLLSRAEERRVDLAGLAREIARTDELALFAVSPRQR
jgi:hypothetical protein